MNVKQKVSMMTASVLPVLALLAYFILAPAKVRASGYDCVWDNAGCPDGYCNDGHSGCTVPVGGWGIFVFCPDENGMYGSGPGTCVSTDCVQCQYGS